MYRKPKFLEVLHDIREEMSRDADYDVELFAEMVRSNKLPRTGPERNIRGYRRRAPAKSDVAGKPEVEELNAENKIGETTKNDATMKSDATIEGDATTARRVRPKRTA